jgi:type II secretory pathway pseudopilin PulG
MNRHFWRACDRGAGFSFVELLVTIIVAGIAFAALVPLFVQTAKATSSDKARNLAKNIGQDRIEKIRQLPYNLITENNLKSSTNRLAHTTTPIYPEWKWAAQFGPTAIAQNEGGFSKQYDVTYSVVFVGGNDNGTARLETSTGDGTEDYLEVTVAVTWQGNPKPAKTVHLSTLIFRQNDGPQITGLDVTSTFGINTEGWLTASTLADPITFRAVIGPADGGLVKLVKFRVDGPGGPYLLANGVLDASVSPAVAYKSTWPWNPPTIVDGVYTVSATAYSSATGYKVYAGNTWTRMLTVEQGAPPAPTGGFARAGDHEVLLSWKEAASNSDVASYDIYRASSNSPAQAVRIGTFSGQFGPAMPPAFVDWGSSSDGPPDGTIPTNTTYYYWIVARDKLGNPADPSSGVPSTSAAGPIPATTVAVANVTPPTVSSSATTAAATNQSIVVNWVAEGLANTGVTVGGDAIDPNSDAHLGGYLVFRDPDLKQPYGMRLLKGTTWTDLNAGWETNRTYSLRAFDGSLNMSSPYASATASTSSPPLYKMKLTTIGACMVTVKKRPAETIVADSQPVLSGSSLTLNVTPGDYDITAVSGTTTKYQTQTIIASDLLSVPTGF